MNLFQSHPDFYNQLIRLSEEEKAEPHEVLHNFFQNCPFAVIRQTLWSMVETSLAVPYSVYDNAGERQTLLWFYRELETVLEAAFLLSKEQEKKEPSR